jgi:cell division protein FtsB
MNIASDMNNPQFVGATNPDRLLKATFYRKELKNEFESEKQGRPIYQEYDFVRIEIPGRLDTVIDTFMRPEHIARFPGEWALYKEGLDTMKVPGTPIDQWPIISRSEAEELRGMKFYSVEQIANASDLQKQTLGMRAPFLVQKAQAFLAAAHDTALVQSQAAELERKAQTETELRAEMKRMSEQMQEMAKQIEPKAKRQYVRRAVEQPEVTTEGV